MNRHQFPFVLVIMLLLVLSACKKDSEEDTVETVEPKETLFTLMNSETTGVDFINEVKNGESDVWGRMFLGY